MLDGCLIGAQLVGRSEYAALFGGMQIAMFGQYPCQTHHTPQELEAQLAATQGAVAEERARSEMVARTGSELLQRNQLLLEQLAEFRAAGQEQDGMRVGVRE